VELGSPDDSALVGALAGEVVGSDSQSAGPEGGLAEGAVGSAEAGFEDWMARVCLPRAFATLLCWTIGVC
jgi:hypothetical protein